MRRCFFGLIALFMISSLSADLDIEDSIEIVSNKARLKKHGLQDLDVEYQKRIQDPESGFNVIAKIYKKNLENPEFDHKVHVFADSLSNCVERFIGDLEKVFIENFHSSIVENFTSQLDKYLPYPNSIQLFATFNFGVFETDDQEFLDQYRKLQVEYYLKTALIEEMYEDSDYEEFMEDLLENDFNEKRIASVKNSSDPTVSKDLYETVTSIEKCMDTFSELLDQYTSSEAVESPDLFLPFIETSLDQLKESMEKLVSVYENQFEDLQNESETLLDEFNERVEQELEALGIDI